MLHGHGDDGYRQDVTIRANFSSNVRPDAELGALREHLYAHFARVASYPEAGAESLTVRLAAAHGLPSSRVVVTNGATAAIYLIAQAFRARRSCVVEPTFSEYADACLLHGHTVKSLDRARFTAGDFADADLVWLCNPNSPTGEVTPRETLLGLIARHPSIRFVVDIAYVDFCDEPPIRPTDVRTHANLLVLQSLTKLHGIPGLRLGYVTGSEEEVAMLVRHQGPWAANALAVEAGRFLLAHPAPWSRGAYLAEARRLMVALAAIRGIAVRPSATGFFLLELTHGTAAELKTYLLHEHGLLIRDASNFRGLGPHHVRIAAQTPEKNRWLEEAMAQWKR